jgi:hypothetical protein
MDLEGRRDCRNSDTVVGEGAEGVCEKVGGRDSNIYIHRYPGHQKAHGRSYLGALEAQNCGVCAWRAATCRSRG